MKTKSIILAILILFSVSNSIFALTASFQGLGDLPGGYFRSQAYDVSSDGSVVVGTSSSSSGEEAFRWENGQMVGLGDLPGGDFYSQANGISADGSVIVGRGKSASGHEAFRWENGQMVSLGDLPGGSFSSNAYGVSADGSVVVGRSSSASGDEAFRWTSGSGMVGLGDLPGGAPPVGNFSSGAFGVSADGSVVAGYSRSASGTETFRWQDLNGNGQLDEYEKLDNHPEFGLGDLPGGGFYSTAFGISANGSVIVGESGSASGIEAFRWENDQMVGLGDLPGGGFYSTAFDVSANGLVVVGDGCPGIGQEAFIWDAENGMRNLKDVLVNDCGLDLTDWRLWSAQGVSADGLTIVGFGYNPDGHIEGWIATIPEPATILLFGLGGIFLKRRRS